MTNGTVEEANGLGETVVNGSSIFPYGMQWQYPCKLPRITVGVTSLNNNTQAEECLPQQIEQNGLSEEGRYRSNQAGSRDMQRPFFISTWVWERSLQT